MFAPAVPYVFWEHGHAEGEEVPGKPGDEKDDRYGSNHLVCSLTTNVVALVLALKE